MALALAVDSCKLHHYCTLGLDCLRLYNFCARSYLD